MIRIQERKLVSLHVVLSWQSKLEESAKYSSKYDLCKTLDLWKPSLFPKGKNRLNNVWFKQDFLFK